MKKLGLLGLALALGMSSVAMAAADVRVGYNDKTISTPGIAANAQNSYTIMVYKNTSEALTAADIMFVDQIDNPDASTIFNTLGSKALDEGKYIVKTGSSDNTVAKEYSFYVLKDNGISNLQYATGAENTRAFAITMDPNGGAYKSFGMKFYVKSGDDWYQAADAQSFEDLKLPEVDGALVDFAYQLTNVPEDGVDEIMALVEGTDNTLAISSNSANNGKFVQQ